MVATSGVSVLWLMMLLSGGGVGLPLGVPPLPEDPLLAKVAPQECLLYFTSAGMAKPDAKSANHTEKLFAEPELHRLAAQVEKLARTHLKEAIRRGSPKDQALAEEVPTLVKVLLTRPLAFYVAEVKLVPKAPPQVRAGAVVSLGDDADKVRAALVRCLSATAPDQAKEVTVEGTTFYRLPLGHGGPDLTWGVKDKYLYAATGEGEIEALLKRGEGSAPQWLIALHKQLPVERVSTVGMVNVHALAELLAPLGGPEVGKVLEATGAAGIDRLAGVSGLDKEGFVSRSLVSFRGPPRGLLQLADQKPLTTADLNLIPRDATFAAAWKLDPEKARATILATAEKIDPKAKEALDGKLAGPARELLDEVFKAVGDTWCVFDSPSEGGLFTGVTAVVSLKDADAAVAVQKKLVHLVQSEAAKVPDPRRARIDEFTFAHRTVYVFDSGEKGFPLAPSWCLTDKHLVVALYPEAIKGFLSRGKSFQSLAKVPEVGAALKGEGQTVALSYMDARRGFDMLYPLLPVLFHSLAADLRRQGIDVPPDLLPAAQVIRPHLRPSVATVRRTPAGIEIDSRQTIPGNMGASTLPVAVGLLVPAVQKVRDAASRMQSSNNLKQIALATHLYVNTNGTFPPAYSTDKAGKPLLSWRVLILPYIEAGDLYKEFHLDEPWDSEHNKKLIARMPVIYRSPASAAGPGMTNYETVRGANTAFPGATGTKIADITDGLSNTILAVEVPDKKAVIWTRPDDFEFDDKDPRAGLLGLRSGGFLAALCDGSVRFISDSIDPKVLRNLFIRNDGNPLPADY